MSRSEPHIPDLQTVLDAYASETSEADPQELAGWLRQYPEYARELMEFAAARSVVQSLQPEHDSTVDEEALVARGMALLDEVMGVAAGAAEAADPIVDLLVAARDQGLSPHDLAEAVGLSSALLTKLRRRLLRADSIPRSLIEELSLVLRYSPEAVVAYLRQAPVLATGASYRSEQAPSLAAQQDFGEAVRTDPAVTPENRRRWLAAVEAEGEE